MNERVLITGGAGFIGSHLCDELLAHGYRVRALDVLAPQVHGPHAQRPSELAREVELLVGDVRDRTVMSRALAGVDAVVHFAAKVGVGQSMYAVDDYTSVNDYGTAVLLQALIDQPVSKLLVASSMSVYGEGLYRTRDGSTCTVEMRPLASLERKQWEPRDASGQPLVPVPTPESKQPSLASIYALSKYDQEQMCLIFGRAYRIPTCALRFFNVYGPRQALSNPYTGVLAIFASRILNGNAPLVFEDGLQRRDFVHVHDVVRACRLALEAKAVDGDVLNIASGRDFSVLEVAARIATALGRPQTAPEISGSYRVGDIRHCFADIRAAQSKLGFVPEIDFDSGMLDLASWLQHQVAVDRVSEARAELVARRLAV